MQQLARCRRAAEQRNRQHRQRGRADKAAAAHPLTRDNRDRERRQQREADRPETDRQADRAAGQQQPTGARAFDIKQKARGSRDQRCRVQAVAEDVGKSCRIGAEKCQGGNCGRCAKALRPPADRRREQPNRSDI